MNNNTFKLRRIEICHVCGTHYQQLFKSHKLCRQCYHGIKHANAVYIALNELRLSKNHCYSMEAKP